MTRRQVTALAIVFALAPLTSGCNQLKARDQLNKGVMAFRNSQYPQAVEHFKKAVTDDPTFINARLYLGTAYFMQYIPAGTSPANLQTANNAIQSFQDVIKMAPARSKAIQTALARIALLYYDMKDFDHAKEYQQKLIAIEPNDPTPYHWIGVIDWALAYQNDGVLRKTLKLNIPDAKTLELPPLPPEASDQLSQENSQLVADGINALKKAHSLRPNDPDTMTYLNLLYRQRADTDSNPDARKADLQKANDWAQQSEDARKAAGGSS